MHMHINLIEMMSHIFFIKKITSIDQKLIAFDRQYEKWKYRKVLFLPKALKAQVLLKIR